jgi:hypothetical protein
MADVSGKFFSAKKVRTGVSPSSPGVEQGETLPPVNPPGSDLNSVGLSMPSAFEVANSPLTSNGTIAVTGAGTVAQYVRGDGSLADFPESIGSGASVSYYLNGSVNQGTIGGVTYYEMNKTPIIGAGTDFTRNSNGYIASFLTDANDPSLLVIPAGNWNFETYFQASSGGGSPTFYLELYKYDGTTFSLIASNSGTPKLINDGTSIEAYFSALAVPQTTLTLTDRLAIRIYVTTAGRTLTLHTENGHLCQVITTFTTGLSALNGLTSQVQFFAVGTSGTNFNIASATDTHTFNLPTASATNRGALSSTDWTTFNNKQNQLNGTGFVKASGTTITYDNSTYQVTSEKGQPNGYASLDSNGKVPLTQINDALIGNVNYQGLWNASTNTPTLANPPSSGTKGYYYIVSTAGMFASISFEVGDWIISNGSAWQKVDNTDAVSSVFGRTGNVTAANGDYNTSQVTENTNLYFTNARAIASVLTGYTSGAGTISAADTILSAIQKLNGNIGALVTGVSSVNGKTGVVTLITTDIAEGTNLYFTQARVSANTDVAANTAARHAAVTLGTANGLSLNTQQLSLGLASAGVTGALSGTDWSTFNSKQNALINPVTGSGSDNRVPKFINGTEIIDSSIFDGPTQVSITNELAVADTSNNYLIITPNDGTNTAITSNPTRPLLIHTNSSSLKLAAGSPAPQITLASTGVVTLTNLAGTGTRMVVASSTGVLSTQAITVGTVTSVAALTLGTTGTDLSSTVANGTTTPVITLNVPTASAANRGALSAADWTTFNNKENAITAGTTAQYFRGDKTFQTLNTAAVPEVTNLYFTTARVLATALTGYTSGANTALAATDTILEAFGKVQGQINAKQNALNGTGFVKATGTTISYDNTNYLPLTGGTLTGTLNGTNAVFSNTVTANQGTFTDGNQGLIIGYYTGGNGYGALYASTLTPNNSNYSFIAKSDNTVVNAPTGGSVNVSIANTIALTIDSSRNAQLAGKFSLRADASASVTTHIPVFIANPSATTRELVTRTPAQFRSDINAQAALTNPVTGTGTAGQVAYWSSTSAITGESNLFWDATNDRLGISQPGPGAKLDIVSTGTGSEGLRVDGAGGGFAFVVKGGTDYSTHIRAGATIGASYFTTPPVNGLIVQGNVGIGTTNPVVALDLGGATGKSIHLYSSAGDFYGINMLNYDSGPFSTNIFAGDGGQIKFRTASGTTTQSTRMTISASGNVGIGTDSPESGWRFDVAGIATMGGTAGNGRLYISTEGTTNGATYIQARNLSVGTPLRFFSSVNIFDSNVLINKTNNEGFKLDVNGTGRFSGAGNALRLNSTSNDVWQTFIPQSGNTWRIQATTGNVFGIYNENSAFFPLTISSTGAATFSSSVTAGDISFFRKASGAAQQQIRLLSATDSYATQWAFGNTPNSLNLSAAYFNGSAWSNDFFTITTGGNVGIGTASPSARLEVRGSTAQILISQDSTHQMYFGVDSSYGEIQAIRSGVAFDKPLILQRQGGNVLIGTTTDGSARLRVNGDILIPADGRLYGNSATVTGSRSYLELYNSATGNINLVTGFSTASIVFATQQGTERMRITSGGDVIIGTPLGSGNKLRIDGSVYAEGNVLLGVSNPYVGRGTSAGVQHIKFNSTGDIFINATSGKSTTFYENNNYLGEFSQAHVRTIGGVLTGTPATSAAAIWKLGTPVNGTVTPNRLIRVEIAGVEYDLVARQII